jgi:hypothetical protein
MRTAATANRAAGSARMLPCVIGGRWGCFIKYKAVITPASTTKGLCDPSSMLDTDMSSALFWLLALGD